MFPIKSGQRSIFITIIDIRICLKNIQSKSKRVWGKIESNISEEDKEKKKECMKEHKRIITTNV